MTLTTFLVSLICACLSGGGVYFYLRKQSEEIEKKAKQDSHRLSQEIIDLREQLANKGSDIQTQIESNKTLYTKHITEFMDESANQTDKVSHQLEEVSEQIRSLGELILEVNRSTASTEQFSASGMQLVNQVADNLKSFAKSKDELVGIQSQFEEVRNKTESIRYIGEEAEMLALNAAIEAARAGEAGRGFAVVADSMKSLSRNSQETTVDIKNIVTESEKTINQVVQDFLQRNDLFTEAVNNLLDSFTQIRDSISTISDMSDSIEAKSNDSSDAIIAVENVIKTALETQVSELSKLVSVITGVSIVNISPHEAQAKLSEFDDIIDVRRPEEWNDSLGHISQARLSTLQTDFTSEVKKLDSNKKYLFVCRSGGRSTKAAQMAINHGVKDVYNLDGGMLEWRKVFT